MSKIFSIKILPSIITLGNLFCGFLAIAYTADNKITSAAWLIFAGMIFDVLDGKVARLTKGSSDFGMQLDSLSDMISFGVAPAFLAKVYLSQPPTILTTRIVWVFCFLFAMCACLRLARFNVETDHDESSHLYFKGLATPGASGVLASLILAGELITEVVSPIYFKIFMISSILALAMLMVSRVKYLHVGVHFLKRRRPVTHLVAIVFFVGLVAVEPNIFVVALASAFFFYAMFSPLREFIYWLIRPQAPQNKETADLLPNKENVESYKDIMPKAENEGV